MFKSHLGNLLRRGLVGTSPAGHRPAPREDAPGYVSEFARYMDGYLEHHPEVVEDQRRGWAIWWKRKSDPRDEEKVAQDTVPPDAYYYFATRPPSADR